MHEFTIVYSNDIWFYTQQVRYGGVENRVDPICSMPYP